MSTESTIGARAASGPSDAVAAPRHRPLYLELWRRVPLELLYLLLALPVALVGFTVTIGLFASGVGSIWTFILGVVLVIAALYVSRAFGVFELMRLEWAGRPRIVRPEWQDARARQGFLGWLRSVLGNGHYWLYLLHTMIVSFVISLVTWSLTVVVLATVVGGLTAWIWNLLPGEGGGFQFGFSGEGAPGVGVARIVLSFLLGAVALAVLPFVTRGLVILHDAVARGMLGAFKSDGLQRQLIAAGASRTAAAAAEGLALRKLERDIHDGPQQRLVRLQMDLAAADRQLDTDPEKARAILAEALQQSKDALEELRSLSRGFAPPILMDRGLVAALESAATRSPLRTSVASSVPPTTPIPQEIERNAYFVASEAIANAAKHSGATSVEVRLRIVGVGEPDAAAPAAALPTASPDAGPDPTLELVVVDDGIGGAELTPGHGLAGLEERLRGLGGDLAVSSPQGGPTTVTARFPLAR